MTTTNWTEVKRAWAEGRTIQCKRSEHGTWLDYGSENRLDRSENMDWRVKPKVVAARMYMRDAGSPVDVEYEGNHFEDNYWNGEWTEVPNE